MACLWIDLLDENFLDVLHRPSGKFAFGERERIRARAVVVADAADNAYPVLHQSAAVDADGLIYGEGLVAGDELHSDVGRECPDVALEGSHLVGRDGAVGTVGGVRPAVAPGHVAYATEQRRHLVFAEPEEEHARQVGLLLLYAFPFLVEADDGVRRVVERHLLVELREQHLYGLADIVGRHAVAKPHDEPARCAVVDPVGHAGEDPEPLPFRKLPVLNH